MGPEALPFLTRRFRTEEKFRRKFYSSFYHTVPAPIRRNLTVPNADRPTLTALKILAAMGPNAQDALPKIEALVGRTEVSITVAAIETLSKIQVSSAWSIKGFERALNDWRSYLTINRNSITPANFACSALVQAGPEGMKVLHKAFSSPDPRVRALVPAAFFQQQPNSPMTMEIIERASRDPAPEVRNVGEVLRKDMEKRKTPSPKAPARKKSSRL